MRHVTVERWLAADPDPDTRAELQRLREHDPEELEQRFARRLAFGTAGIRGPMGAGPARMNRVLVRMVASALGQRLQSEHEGTAHVVVGYDARHRSDIFANDTARVLAAQGIRVTMLPEPLPTPVAAFAVKHLDASAGVMVTASHNPRPDNGCKVYWRSGRQLAAPVDAEISEIIDRTAPLAESKLAAADDGLIATAGDGLVEAYVDAVAGLVTPGGARSARIAYTPLHGVGAATFERALDRAGFDPPEVVAEQGDPDPDFPTAAFPNPEEAGVLNPLLALAARIDADVALAHDPDADRLGVAVPEHGRWRVLSGDEIGCLLAEHLLSGGGGGCAGSGGCADGDSPDDLTLQRKSLAINTVVSSRLLARIAAYHGADWAETLTGFKWIMAAAAERAHSHRLVLGYEDALGYAVGEVVNDKDGIGAALVMLELVAHLKQHNRSVCDLLDDLCVRHGVHVTGQRSIRFESRASDAGGPAAMQRAMDALRSAGVGQLAGVAVGATHDLAEGDGHLPAADVIVFEMRGGGAEDGGHSRVIVRPSGTEPKMKIYGEVVAPVRDASQVDAARSESGRRIARLLDATVELVSDLARR